MLRYNYSDWYRCENYPRDWMFNLSYLFVTPTSGRDTDTALLTKNTGRLIWSLQTLRGGVYDERSSNGVSKYSLKPLTSTPSLVVTTLPYQAHHLVDTWYQDHGTTRAVLTCLGALGPPGWWGHYHPYGTRGAVGAVVLCISEYGNTHLGPNQGRTWCQFTIYEMELNLLSLVNMHEDWRDMYTAQKL